MLSKKKISEITSLHQKKFRQTTGLFIAEGEKIITELIHSGEEITDIYATSDLFESFGQQIKALQLIETQTFSKLSAQKSPSGILAVVKQRKTIIHAADLKNKFTLCLDGVRDPGNLGTIIRIADWFGIEHVICSNDTVELYNPKVIQASMGSFIRVKLCYTNLDELIPEAKSLQIPVFGATLKGQNVYLSKHSGEGIIIMGSESHGISASLLTLLDTEITIPSKLLAANSETQAPIDSLNVAVACSIVFAVFASSRAR